MGFKRPQVRLLSLGPRKRGMTKRSSLVFSLKESDRSRTGVKKTVRWTVFSPMRCSALTGCTETHRRDLATALYKKLSLGPILIKVDSKRIDLNFFVLFRLLSALLFV